MRKRTGAWVGWLVVALLGGAAVGCNDPSPLTVDGVPIGELVTDTFYLEAYSAAEIDYRTDLFGIRVSNGGVAVPLVSVVPASQQASVIGLLRDPDFGTVASAAYVEFLPDFAFFLQAAEQDSARNIVVDSVVLQLRLSSAYGSIEGDSSAQVNLIVYPLQDTLQTPSDIQNSSPTGGHYYSDSVAVNNSVNLVQNGPFQFLNDSITTVRAQLAPQLWQTIFDGGIDQLAVGDSLTRIIFPGLYLTHRPTGVSDLVNSPGSLWKIDLSNQGSNSGPAPEADSSGTRIEVYTRFEYSPDSGAFRDTTVRFDFVPSLRTDEPSNTRLFPQRFHTFSRFNVAGKPAEQALAGVEDRSAQQLFIQAGNGALIRFRLPDRSNFLFSQPQGAPILVTRASLELDLDTTFYSVDLIDRFFGRPAGIPGFTGELEVYETTPGSNTENLSSVVAGRLLPNSLEFEETYMYSTNLSQNLQNYILGVNDIRDFTIVYLNKHFTLRRGIFIGPGHPDILRRPRLVVTYNRPPSAVSGN